MSRQTRMESLLIALVQIPEGLLRVLTLCYLDIGWTNSLSAWSLKRGLARSKKQRAMVKQEVFDRLNERIGQLLLERAEISDTILRKEISEEIAFCFTTAEKFKKEIDRLTSK